MKLYNTICYKTKTPVVYNKGTQWESSCDEFLAYYTNYSDERAQAEADRLNTEKPEFLPTGAPAHCDERFYFVHKQEAMGD